MTKSCQLFANLMWGAFKLPGVFGSRDKGIPTASFGTVFDTTETRTVDVRGYLDLTYERELGRGWNLTSRASYSQFSQRDGIVCLRLFCIGGAFPSAQ